MNILITRQNVDFFLNINPNLKIVDNTVNTALIKCSEKTFIKLRDEVRSKGLNPFAVMAW